MIYPKQKGVQERLDRFRKRGLTIPSDAVGQHYRTYCYAKSPYATGMVCTRLKGHVCSLHVGTYNNSGSLEDSNIADLWGFVGEEG